VFKANAYAIASHLDMYSDVTYDLEHPIDLDPTGIDGDQFEQAEQRSVLFHGPRMSEAFGEVIDLDIAASRAHFDEDQGEAPNIGRFVPGSIDKVASFGATLTDFGPWFGQFQLRYFGPRPLIEDDSQNVPDDADGELLGAARRSAHVLRLR